MMAHMAERGSRFMENLLRRRGVDTGNNTNDYESAKDKYTLVKFEPLLQPA